ncbi:MAG TPA: peroxide stress protein YaaA [Candidatus Dorea intestinavium]|nr:peroxide stress protein YaaA [Candidatus Dorea intestinavium]
MRIIISPAKTMRVEEMIGPSDMPVFLDKTTTIMEFLKSLSYEELKNLWKCSDKLATENYERLRTMDLEKNASPAILSFEGIQYQYMAPSVMEENSLAWLQEHLRILSGFYGILRPMDGVVPYRLEMQAKASIRGSRNLYDFWGDSLYQELTKGDQVILNLASKEYSRNIESYLTKKDQFITCVFAQEVKGKLVQRATIAKMARGEMVRFLATTNAKSVEEAKEFKGLDFAFSPKESSENEYVFIKSK